MPKAAINGIELYYESHGSGRPLSSPMAAAATI